MNLYEWDFRKAKEKIETKQNTLMRNRPKLFNKLVYIWFIHFIILKTLCVDNQVATLTIHFVKYFRMKIVYSNRNILYFVAIYVCAYIPIQWLCSNERVENGLIALLNNKKKKKKHKQIKRIFSHIRSIDANCLCSGNIQTHIQKHNKKKQSDVELIWAVDRINKDIKS